MDGAMEVFWGRNRGETGAKPRLDELLRLEALPARLLACATPERRSTESADAALNHAIDAAPDDMSGGCRCGQECSSFRFAVVARRWRALAGDAVVPLVEDLVLRIRE